jgi:hypothetical protein
MFCSLVGYSSLKRMRGHRVSVELGVMPAEINEGHIGSVVWWDIPAELE